VVIDSLNPHAPRWLAEGFAIYLAGEGRLVSGYAPKGKMTTEEIERRLAHAGSQPEMRVAYGAAYQAVNEIAKSEGEAAVWKRLKKP
jgi:hypothetical protein